MGLNLDITIDIKQLKKITSLLGIMFHSNVWRSKHVFCQIWTNELEIDFQNQKCQWHSIKMSMTLNKNVVSIYLLLKPIGTGNTLIWFYSNCLVISRQMSSDIITKKNGGSFFIWHTVNAYIVFPLRRNPSVYKWELIS